MDGVLNQHSSKLRHSWINHENEKSSLKEFGIGGATHGFQSTFHGQSYLYTYPEIPVPSSLLSQRGNNDFFYLKKCKIHAVLMAELRLIPRALISGPFVCNICTRCPSVTQCILSLSFGHKGPCDTDEIETF